MQVRYTKGRQLCYKETICCFVQDISNIAEKLPRMPEECDVIIIHRESIDMTSHVDSMVRRDKLRRALAWKIEHDPNYAAFLLNRKLTAVWPWQRWTRRILRR